MSQKDVERTLGRLLTDSSFRRVFFRDADRACVVLGVDLADHELEALLRLPARQFTDLAEELDDRICRLSIDDVDADGSSAEDPRS